MRRSRRALYDVFKSELATGAKFSPIFEFPQLRGTHFKPTQAIPFEKACTAANYQQWVHFYTHDRNFERIWSNSKRYLPILQRFSGVITPDFSVYREMPLSMQIWNTYRNRAIAFWLQREGVPIISNVRWGDERTYEFAFEGLLKAEQSPSAPMARCAINLIGSISKRGWLAWWKHSSRKPSSITARRRTIFLIYTGQLVWK